jgi:hypothetical protein
MSSSKRAKKIRMKPSLSIFTIVGGISLIGVVTMSSYINMQHAAGDQPRRDLHLLKFKHGKWGYI